MYLTPLPGISRSDVLVTLQTLRTELGNIRGKGLVASELSTNYVAWAVDSARVLRGRVRESEIDRLVLTARFWALQARIGDAAVAPVVELEIDDRALALDQTIGELATEVDFGRYRPGRVVIADTCVFVDHVSKLEALDFAGLLGARETPIRLVIPIVLIDELDGLKTHRARKHVAWRASYTLSFLDRILDHSGYGVVREEDFSALETGGIPRGRITAEIAFDPPGHNRLPINDDEIVDRALAFQAASGRHVDLITFDTKMRLRARTASLDVLQLSQSEAIDASKTRKPTPT